MVQVGPTTLLARGAVVRLAAPIGTRVRAHVAASGITAVSRAMLDQAAVVSTELPAHVTVVGVLRRRADRRRCSAPRTSWCTSTARPSTRCRSRSPPAAAPLFLYDLTDPDPDRRRGSRSASGSPDVPRWPASSATDGSAAGWAAALAGTTLTQLVPDEHLTPDGTVRVRLAKGGRADG